jgi:TolB-like protein
MIYRFGSYTLDTAVYELRCDGAPVAIEPQVFSLLHHLIAHRDEVVSKDDLIDAVWDGRIVSDATLSSRISAARRAIGDTGEAQALIRTAPRRGFRFVGDVAAAEETDTAAAAIQDPGDPGDSSAAADPPPRSPETPTLAVLPFDNLSAEVDEYFADGLTEDIITNLARFRELQVIARTSTFQFKGRAANLAQIAAELGAGYVVEGSVRRAGGRVRITAQLIDAASGVHLWADHYDREMEDIFAVQDEVTRTIAATLGVKLQDAALKQSLKKSPAALDAYDCVLQARRYTSLLSAEMHAEARELLEKAVALDPSSADAHALLANVYLAEHRFGTNPRPDPVGRALKMAQTATRLDPQNAYAHCWLANVHFFRGENEQFEAEAQRALALNPNDPETLADIGHYLAFMGEFERGIELSGRARQLNPLHPGWYYFSFARYHYDQRAYEETLADVQRISMPHFYWSWVLQAAAEGQLGRAQAGASLAQIYALKPDFAARAELQKWNVAPDDQEHILDGLRKAGLEE